MGNSALEKQEKQLADKHEFLSILHVCRLNPYKI
jgi:hypothetical protein